MFVINLITIIKTKSLTEKEYEKGFYLGFGINIVIFASMIGIYSITCLVNNKIYIGSSINIPDRLMDHKTKLNKNKHKNSHLQRSFNKHGIGNFKFNIVEECSRETILERENYYMILYGSLSSKKGFNQVVAQRQDNLYSNKEYINKLSMVKKGKMPSNLDYLRALARKPILEFENGNFVREYGSTVEAGKILGINHKLINNILRNYTKNVRKYPNKTWTYKKSVGV